MTVITRAGLLERLQEIAEIQAAGEGDPERDHSVADALVLGYLDDLEILIAFNRIKKWYA